MITYIWYATAFISRFLASCLAIVAIIGTLPWEGNSGSKYNYIRLTLVQNGEVVISTKGNLLEVAEVMPGLYALAELTEMTQGPPGSFLFEAIEFAFKSGKVGIGTILLFGSVLLLVLLLFVGAFTWAYSPLGAGSLGLSFIVVLVFFALIGPAPFIGAGFSIQPLTGFWLHMCAILVAIIAASIGF